MVKINVDTTQLSDCGNDILNEADSYKNNINGLYKRLSDIPIKTKEWEGEAASKYINKIVKEKSIYDDYYYQLEKLGNYMIDYAVDLDSIAKKNEID